MEANVSIMRYAKGAKTAKNTIKKAIKNGITFSTELIVLSILLLIYSGAASVITITMISLAVILLIASLISEYVFSTKMNEFYLDHSSDVVELHSSENKEKYLDVSMNLLKMGTYTAIVNIITTVLSLVTLCVLLFNILK